MRYEVELNMSLSKRLKRLWILLTSDEIYNLHAAIGRRKTVRKAPRA